MTFFIVYLGVRFAEQNRLLEAIECFSQAIALNPQNPSPYNNRAQTYQLLNRTEGYFDCCIDYVICFFSGRSYV